MQKLEPGLLIFLKHNNCSYFRKEQSVLQEGLAWEQPCAEQHLETS